MPPSHSALFSHLFSTPPRLLSSSLSLHSFPSVLLSRYLTMIQITQFCITLVPSVIVFTARVLFSINPSLPGAYSVRLMTMQERLQWMVKRQMESS